MANEEICSILYKNIMLLNLKPGQMLNVNSLAEELGVSRSPVRDALIELSKEGLVDIFPQKGTYVSRIDFERAEEERFLRESIEEKVIPLFIKYCEEMDFLRLEGKITLQKEHFKAGDYAGFLEFDDRFHEIFFERTQKLMCWEVIRASSGHYRRIRLLTSQDAEIAVGVIAEHEEILLAAKKRDAAKCLELYRAHSSKLPMQKEKLMEKYPDYFKQPFLKRGSLI